VTRVALAALCACACGANGGSSPVTLQSSAVGKGNGLDLATLSVIADGYDNPAVDFFMQQAMVVSLRGQHDDTFCGKGRDFQRLADIPLALDDCPASLSKGWERIAYLGGSSVHPASDSFAAGYGYLVRARDRVSLYRVLVLGDSYDSSGLASAVLDVELVP
jgi:hypothetical protein